MTRQYSKGGVSKNHGSWRAYVHYTDEDGTRHMLSRQTPVPCKERDNSGRPAALEYKRKWRDRLVQEEERRRMAVPGGNASELTFYEYARRFLEHHAVAEVTAKGYKAALNV